MIDTRNEKLPPMPNTDREHWAAINRKWKRQQRRQEVRDVVAYAAAFTGMVAVCIAVIAGVLIIAVHLRMS